MSGHREPPPGMRMVAGTRFTMGSDTFYEEERPTREVYVDPFWIDETPVTNRAFASFVSATGYRTLAEKAPTAELYPGLDPAAAAPGSLVFQRSRAPVPLDDPMQWWAFVAGADWQHPLGPDSDLSGLEDHPVVHIAYEDAAAYAKWAGKSLPTEAQWECAARGGLDGAPYAWGDELEPGGTILANYWRGAFPFSNLRTDGYRTTAVRSYPANGHGLFDMIGNVWEWTRDWYAGGLDRAAGKPCCVPVNPRGGTLGGSYDPDMPGLRIGRKVLKGGSHLCAANYCQRYRPSARHPQMVDSATSHIGFRCISRP